VPDTNCNPHVVRISTEPVICPVTGTVHALVSNPHVVVQASVPPVKPGWPAHVLPPKSAPSHSSNPLRSPSPQNAALAAVSAHAKPIEQSASEEQLGVQKPENNEVSQANPVAHCVLSVQVLLHVDVIGSHATPGEQSASEEQLGSQKPAPSQPKPTEQSAAVVQVAAQKPEKPSEANVVSQANPVAHCVLSVQSKLHIDVVVLHAKPEKQSASEEQLGVQKPGELNVVSQTFPVAHCVLSIQELLHVDVIRSHTAPKQSASEEQLRLQKPAPSQPKPTEQSAAVVQLAAQKPGENVVSQANPVAHCVLSVQVLLHKDVLGSHAKPGPQSASEEQGGAQKPAPSQPKPKEQSAAVVQVATQKPEKLGEANVVSQTNPVAHCVSSIQSKLHKDVLGSHAEPEEQSASEEQLGIQEPDELNLVSQTFPVAHCVLSVQVLLHVDVIGSHTVPKQSASEEQLVLQIPTTPGSVVPAKQSGIPSPSKSKVSLNPGHISHASGTPSKSESSCCEGQVSAQLGIPSPSVSRVSSAHPKITPVSMVLPIIIFVSVAPERIARVRSALEKSAKERLAPVKSASVSVAAKNLAPWRLALTKTARVRSIPANRGSLLRSQFV